MKPASGSAPLVAARGLAQTFVTEDGRRVAALAGVDIDVPQGGAVGIVGESGSGKTTLGRALLRLIEPTAGAVRFRGSDLLALDRRALRRARRHMQMVFQDPYGSINPRQRVGAMLEEPLIVHGEGDGAARRRAVGAILDAVGLAADDARKFPHQFSGGQRQRLAIARAAILGPQLIVADEPVSALDVSVRSQVLNLLADLRRTRGVALLLIAHDLAVVGQVCDTVAVMYLGRIVETGTAAALLGAPQHPYSRALVGSAYGLDAARRPRRVLAGEAPDPAAAPSGCPFHPRCPEAMARCRSERPALAERAGDDGPRRTACHLHPPLDDDNTAGGAA